MPTVQSIFDRGAVASYKDRRMKVDNVLHYWKELQSGRTMGLENLETIRFSGALIIYNRMLSKGRDYSILQKLYSPLSIQFVLFYICINGII